MTNELRPVASHAFTHDDILALLSNHNLIKNGGEEHQLPIVVRLFTPDASAQWVIISAEAEGRDLKLYGWCDLGLGFGEMGYAYLSEIDAVTTKFGAAVLRDPEIRLSDHMTLNAWLEVEFDT